MAKMLAGTNIALGVTGSIAAVKVVELAHELRRQGAAVRGVTTPSAASIINPWAVEFATDHPVVTEITGSVEHIELCGDDGWADVLLIAPATANTVGKIAAAIDDTPVTTCATTAIGAGLPVVVAPAMHEPMYDHPGVFEAIDRLEGWGVRVIDPRLEEGKAKLPTEEAIVLETARAVDAAPLAGKHVVVTSGATAEPVDPIRVLTSRASGKTGRAVARGLYVRGATVTLVEGDLGTDDGDSDSDGGDLPFSTRRPVQTTDEMIDATLEAVAGADALVSAAAISDYSMEAAAEKLRSGRDDLSIDLVPTPKLVDAVREAHPDLAMVGFKAETGGDDEAMVEAARELLDRIGATFVVSNDASVMGEDRTRVFFVRADEVEAFEGTKAELGLRVADELAAAC